MHEEEHAQRPASVASKADLAKTRAWDSHAPPEDGMETAANKEHSRQPLAFRTEKPAG